jgi:hypothetical protein
VALLVDYGVAKLAHKEATHSAVFIWLRRAVFTLAGIGLLCLGYSFFIEPRRLEITHVRLTSAKLPPGTRPIRFVQISDLHSGARTHLEARLPGVIAAQRPDFILFTGDAVSSPEGVATFKRCMVQLSAIAPTFVVKGNWDVWRMEQKEIADFFGGTGVRELQGDAVKVDAGGVSVWLAGAGCWDTDGLLSAIAAIPHGAYGIAVYHHPNLIPDVAETGIDLFCTGHTHGGQVALPWYGGLIKVKGPASHYERGLFRVKNMWAYVNRGIGMEGGFSPHIRFFAPPEVTVFEIAPTGNP